MGVCKGMYRLVKFEDMNQQKYNGCIHYAPNGNAYGYYWYLKAVVKEWDIVVEDDYESVMPIARNRLSEEQWNLLPMLGPYTVNTLTPKRIKSMLELAMNHHQSMRYPLNHLIDRHLLNKLEIRVQSADFTFLSTKPAYEKIVSQYESSVRKVLEKATTIDLHYTGGTKPEKLVQLRNLDHFSTNAYLRLMYNALHRGIGFSTSVENKNTGEILAAQFFIATHNTLFELFQYAKAKEYRWRAIDLVIRNNAGKTIKFITQMDTIDTLAMGFTVKEIAHWDLHGNKMNWRKLLKLPY